MRELVQESLEISIDSLYKQSVLDSSHLSIEFLFRLTNETLLAENINSL